MHKPKNTLHIVNILLMLCMLACLICYDIFGGLRLKGTTSAWFVLLGLLNLIHAQRTHIPQLRFPVLIFLGLVFGMSADILLGVHFISGILSFALGHILYLVAFYTLEKPHKADLFLILPIAAVSVFIVTGTPWIRITDPMLKKLLISYAVIIAAMVGKALSNLRYGRSLARGPIALGSAMFWFSDLILAIDMFGASSRLTWVLCSYVYWPAQTIMAYALFHFSREQASLSKTDRQF